METEREYAEREKRMFRKQVADTEKQSLSDRQEARREFAEIMADYPERVAERAEWILEGNYGFGAYTEAREVAVNRRMNRAAWFVSMVGALDHQCPPEFTMGAWKKLTAAQKKHLDTAVMAVIEAYAKELAPARKAARNGSDLFRAVATSKPSAKQVKTMRSLMNVTMLKVISEANHAGRPLSMADRDALEDQINAAVLGRPVPESFARMVAEAMRTIGVRAVVVPE